MKITELCEMKFVAQGVETYGRFTVPTETAIQMDVGNQQHNVKIITKGHLNVSQSMQTSIVYGSLFFIEVIGVLDLICGEQ